jgi:hypothetical protein
MIDNHLKIFKSCFKRKKYYIINILLYFKIIILNKINNFVVPSQLYGYYINFLSGLYYNSDKIDLNLIFHLHKHNYGQF